MTSTPISTTTSTPPVTSNVITLLDSIRSLTKWNCLETCKTMHDICQQAMAAFTIKYRQVPISTDIFEQEENANRESLVATSKVSHWYYQTRMCRDITQLLWVLDGARRSLLPNEDSALWFEGTEGCLLECLQEASIIKYEMAMKEFSKIDLMAIQRSSALAELYKSIALSVDCHGIDFTEKFLVDHLKAINPTLDIESLKKEALKKMDTTTAKQQKEDSPNNKKKEDSL